MWKWNFSPGRNRRKQQNGSFPGKSGTQSYNREAFLYYKTCTEVGKKSDKATLPVEIHPGGCNSAKIRGFEQFPTCITRSLGGQERTCHSNSEQHGEMEGGDMEILS